MLARLATFLFNNRRRILVLAVIGAAIAGVLGVGVAKRLSPYGANDPATQSVQATNRFQDASHRQVDPGVVAIVASGDVHTKRAQTRITQVAAQLQRQPDVASVATFYTTHDPAMVSRPASRPTSSRTSRRSRTSSSRTTRSGSRTSSRTSPTSRSAAVRSPTRRRTRRSAMTWRGPSCWPSR